MTITMLPRASEPAGPAGCEQRLLQLIGRGHHDHDQIPVTLGGPMFQVMNRLLAVDAKPSCPVRRHERWEGDAAGLGPVRRPGPRRGGQVSKALPGRVPEVVNSGVYPALAGLGASGQHEDFSAGGSR